MIVIGINLLGGGSGGTGGFDLPGVVRPGGSGAGRRQPAADSARRGPPGRLKDFSGYVFDDTQDVWEQHVRRAAAIAYDTAKLVLYSGAVQTDGCGSATSAVGPFYCPADERVYLDLSFYEDMKRQLGASGDFAWAYVIAHEMGHHVQRHDRHERRGRPAQPRGPGGRERALGPPGAPGRLLRRRLGQTVYAAGDLEPGDLDEAFNAAEAVGDDRLQKQATGRVDPDSFTHGTSEQRRWFDRGTTPASRRLRHVLGGPVPSDCDSRRSGRRAAEESSTNRRTTSRCTEPPDRRDRSPSRLSRTSGRRCGPRPSSPG